LAFSPDPRAVSGGFDANREWCLWSSPFSRLGWPPCGVPRKAAMLMTPSVTALTLPLLVWTAARRSTSWLEHPALVAIGVGSYSLYLGSSRS